MRRQSKLYLLALGILLGATSIVLGQDPTFTKIDFPGAITTDSYGINTRGDIVGNYINADKSDHGFLLSGGQYSTIEFPGATATEAFTINPRGDVGGFYSLAGVSHGFLLVGGNTARSISPALPPLKSVQSTLAATSWETTHWPARAVVFC